MKDYLLEMGLNSLVENGWYISIYGMNTLEVMGFQALNISLFTVKEGDCLNLHHLYAKHGH